MTELEALGIITLLVSIIGLGMGAIVMSLVYLWEKKRFNNGICPRCKNVPLLIVPNKRGETPLIYHRCRVCGYVSKVSWRRIDKYPDHEKSRKRRR